MLDSSSTGISVIMDSGKFHLVLDLPTALQNDEPVFYGHMASSRQIITMVGKDALPPTWEIVIYIYGQFMCISSKFSDNLLRFKLCVNIFLSAKKNKYSLQTWANHTDCYR